MMTMNLWFYSVRNFPYHPNSLSSSNIKVTMIRLSSDWWLPSTRPSQADAAPQTAYNDPESCLRCSSRASSIFHGCFLFLRLSAFIRPFILTKWIKPFLFLFSFYLEQISVENGLGAAHAERRFLARGRRGAGAAATAATPTSGGRWRRTLAQERCAATG
jgi:hypothetical protein